jgi:hypothetical protein
VFPPGNKYGTVWDQEAIYKIVNSSLEGTGFPFSHPEAQEINGVTHLYLRQVAYNLYWQREGSNFPTTLPAARRKVENEVLDHRFRGGRMIRVALLEILQDYLVEKGVMNRRKAGRFIDAAFKTIYELIFWRVTSLQSLEQKKKEAKKKATAEKRAHSSGKGSGSAPGGGTGRTTKKIGGDPAYGDPPFKKWRKNIP